MITELWAALVGAGFGGLLAFAAANQQLRRERAYAALDAARLLTQDLGRIEDELGPPGAASLTTTFYGSTVAAPTLHAWSQEAIKALIFVDPELVGLAMRLDRQLSNLGTLAAQVVQARRLIVEARDELSSLDDVQPEDDGPLPPEGFVTAYDEMSNYTRLPPAHLQIQAALERVMAIHGAKERLGEAKQVQANLTGLLGSGDKHARGLLSEMGKRVAEIVARGEPDFLMSNWVQASAI